MALLSPGANPESGGDSSDVRHQLKNVKQITAAVGCICCDPCKMDQW